MDKELREKIFTLLQGQMFHSHLHYSERVTDEKMDILTAKILAIIEQADYRKKSGEPPVLNTMNLREIALKLTNIRDYLTQEEAAKAQWDADVKWYSTLT